MIRPAAVLSALVLATPLSAQEVRIDLLVSPSGSDPVAARYVDGSNDEAQVTVEAIAYLAEDQPVGATCAEATGLWLEYFAVKPDNDVQVLLDIRRGPDGGWLYDGTNQADIFIGAGPDFFYASGSAVALTDARCTGDDRFAAAVTITKPLPLVEQVGLVSGDMTGSMPIRPFSEF